MAFSDYGKYDGVGLAELVRKKEVSAREVIDELALAREWQISRTPLREALKVLAAEGLVTPVPRQGSKVAEMSEDDADELLPVMALLEGRCAFEAVRKASNADIRALQQLHEKLERHAAAHNVDGYYQANHEFHSKVQALARNRWLLDPRRNRLWWQTLSHKALRLVCPVLLAALLVSAAALWVSPFYKAAAIAQGAFYLAAAAGARQRTRGRLSPLVSVPYAFCLLNMATVVCFWRFAVTGQPVTWRRRHRGGRETPAWHPMPGTRVRG